MISALVVTAKMQLIANIHFAKMEIVHKICATAKVTKRRNAPVTFVFIADADKLKFCQV